MRGYVERTTPLAVYAKSLSFVRLFFLSSFLPSQNNYLSIFDVMIISTQQVVSHYRFYNNNNYSLSLE